MQLDNHYINLSGYHTTHFVEINKGLTFLLGSSLSLREAFLLTTDLGETAEL